MSRGGSENAKPCEGREIPGIFFFEKKRYTYHISRYIDIYTVKVG